MKYHRLINILIVGALIVLIGFTVREVTATAALVSPTDSSKAVCDSLPSHFSIRTEYLVETGRWVTYTQDGPTGIDGGLIELLSENRACSK